LSVSLCATAGTTYWWNGSRNWSVCKDRLDFSEGPWRQTGASRGSSTSLGLAPRKEFRFATEAGNTTVRRGETVVIEMVNEQEPSKPASLSWKSAKRLGA
jgi:hypothetical protein